MIDNMMNVGTQVLILFVIVAVGFICRRVGILTANGIKSISDMVVYVVTPANIIVAFCKDFKTELLIGLGKAFLLAFLVYGAATIVAKFAIRENNENKRSVLRFAGAYPNAGYMGIPLQRALLGDIGVFYCAAYIGMFHMYVWTMGVYLLSGDRKQISVKKLLTSPCIIAIIIGLLLFFLPVEPPTIIFSPLQSLASLATPLPMLVIGYHLAGSDLRKIIGNGWVHVAILIKMVFSPILAIVLCLLLKCDHSMAVSCLIACSSSSAAMTTMLATKFNRDAELSAAVVSYTTLLAIIVIPVFVSIVGVLIP
ncbi:MAG: AEC family transporter [Lachnospiraceae bacterium]|nr:AEC family transporter [Lachnospiraceae bacterium]